MPGPVQAFTHKNWMTFTKLHILSSIPIPSLSSGMRTVSPHKVFMLINKVIICVLYRIVPAIFIIMSTFILKGKEPDRIRL